MTAAVRSAAIRTPAMLLVLVTVIAAVVVADPFGGGRPATSRANAVTGTSLVTLVRRSLSAQTLVNGTLGYGGFHVVRLPPGALPTAVAQARVAVMSAQDRVAAAETELSLGRQALAQARAASTGRRASESADEQQVIADATTVVSEQQQAAISALSLASAKARRAVATSAATAYGLDSSFTWLPRAGAVVRAGQRLYAIDGQAALLLYGHTVATRAFHRGMSPGPDVASLNASLDALGFARGLVGEAFTPRTAAAIRGLQAANGLRETGELLLGSVVFEPRAMRVRNVIPVVGAAVTPGPVMTLSSTDRQVAIALDAADQGQVKVGDQVMITLPDDSTTPGRVSYVSTVASSTHGVTSIVVDARLSDPAATGTLDQAPVGVALTTATVTRALVVPVDGLVARAGGGYAVEERGRRGRRRLVPVATGLFDDADGLVQITGAGLAAGQRVVVPSG